MEISVNTSTLEFDYDKIGGMSVAITTAASSDILGLSDNDNQLPSNLFSNINPEFKIIAEWIREDIGNYSKIKEFINDLFYFVALHDSGLIDRRFADSNMGASAIRSFPASILDISDNDPAFTNEKNLLLAKQVIAKMEEPESVEEWASRLANDIGNMTD